MVLHPTIRTFLEAVSKSILAAILVFSMTSCKKDYLCKCSDLSVPDYSFKIHDTKKKAEKKCTETIYFTGGCHLQ
jgi:hypothetical protein